MSRWELLLGDCVELMRDMDDASVDAIVCDPPYGLEFMGKEWDRLGTRNYAGVTEGNDSPHARRHSVNFTGSPNPTCRRCGGLRSLVSEGSGGRRKCRCEHPDFPDYRGAAARAMQSWHEEWAREALRVLKPGGHLLAFGGTRTYHRLAAGIEDAGFEIRDCITWMYGSGFPKSLDVSKAIDKAAGAQREVVGPPPYSRGRAGQAYSETRRVSYDYDPQPITAPATDNAKRWQGWGTALKPASEPIVVARKPLIGTVAGNVLAHGTGALNIDACRVSTGDDLNGGAYSAERQPSQSEWVKNGGTIHSSTGRDFEQPTGRWPANVALSHAEDCVLVGSRRVAANNQTADRADGAVGAWDDRWKAKAGAGHGGPDGREEVELWACVPGCPVRALDEQSGQQKSGVAVRHRSGGNTFGGDAAKPQMEDMSYGDQGGASRFFYCAKASRAERNAGLDGFEEKMPHDDAGHVSANHHPTVKPIELMRWLIRLVTPPDGVILDPFIGSGTTGCAALREGMRFIGCERDEGYVRIAAARIGWWEAHPDGLEQTALLAADARRRKITDSGQLGLL